MDNKTKRHLSSLESRIIKLENIIEGINMGIQSAGQSTYNCNKCGINNPIENNIVCTIQDCCHGLNPNDDN